MHFQIYKLQVFSGFLSVVRDGSSSLSDSHEPPPGALLFFMYFATMTSIIKSQVLKPSSCISRFLQILFSLSWIVIGELVDIIFPIHTAPS